jgi:hypothetical protein
MLQSRRLNVGAHIFLTNLGFLCQPVTEAPTARLKSRGQVAGHRFAIRPSGASSPYTSANSAD